MKVPHASICVRLALFLSLLADCWSLFADDAGELDFLVSTGGHGPPKFAAVLGNSVITSDSAEDGTQSSCYVASRSIDDGSLNWRRNVCSAAQSPSQSHTLSLVNDLLVTLDHLGAVKVWDATSGSLFFDEKLEGKASAWAFASEGNTYVAMSSGSGTAVYSEQGTRVHGVQQKSASGSIGKLANQALCPKSSLWVGFEASSIVLWKTDGDGRKVEQLSSSTSVTSSPTDPFTSSTLLKCSTSGMTVMFTTTRGTTKTVSFDEKGNTGEEWVVEEGLAGVTSAVLLDASHFAVDFDKEKKREMLLFGSRLGSQVARLSGMFAANSSGSTSDNAFGFVKVALLLSSASHRVFGIDTTGSKRSKVRFSVDLPEAGWHRLVHGDVNGKGISRDVLILSSVGQKEMHFSCLEGTSGRVATSGIIELKSPLVQVIPTAVGSGPCHQGAILVLEDSSSVAIPSEAQKEFSAHISATKNGFFFHSLYREAAELRTFVFQRDADESLSSNEIGSMAFTGETIVDVAYPPRDEIIQSPCHALGDNSLLLKYRNPHIVAIVTSREDTVDDEISSHLGKRNNPTKPAGVVAPLPDKARDSPNLFINIVDTVSGQILHRSSHANVAMSPAPAIVISENWVFYTFMNEKTRRSDIGVLTLYEGQIHESGLTAFTTPDRSSSFSSLDTVEAKPVVLTKVYSTARGLTSIGVTTSRGGISNRRLIMATTDGQIHAVDRKMLDPRRPRGELNQFEKKEGLLQYSELIPSVSFMSLSYTQTVESVSNIVTSSTDLESQTLVLAFGGPDVFFIRTSPSRGFDLLPESFNKALLAMVVAGLLVAFFMVKSTADKKIKTQGWI